MNNRGLRRCTPTPLSSVELQLIGTHSQRSLPSYRTFMSMAAMTLSPRMNGWHLTSRLLLTPLRLNSNGWATLTTFVRHPSSPRRWWVAFEATLWAVWACPHCGKYGQRRWGGLAHSCILPPSTAGWSALSRLWTGYHPAARQQGPVWRPDVDAHWANPDPLGL
eukprot:1847365-Amphidinium_carterae.1